MHPRLALPLALLISAGAHAEGDAAAGKAAFARCASCHQVGPSASAGFGPQLNGIVGRRAGATDYAYSDAMKKSGITWTARNLAAFIESPGDVVPGNKMRFWGISDPKKIADLLAYLGSFPAP